jgi:hypothetical protein
MHIVKRRMENKEYHLVDLENLVLASEVDGWI